MINLNDNYSQKEFKFFLKNFLPEDYEEKNSKLHIEETHKFFKKAEYLIINYKIGLICNIMNKMLLFFLSYSSYVLSLSIDEQAKLLNYLPAFQL